MSEANITVIDAIMGSGKTTHMMNHINKTQMDYLVSESQEAPKYIYITMYLDEVKRVIGHCPALQFTEPQAIDGRKLNHLNQLIAEGRNIASTHSLFKLINRGTYDLLKEAGYTLVIDEALDCVDLYESITSDDLKNLFALGMIYRDDKNCLRWDHEKFPRYQGKFQSFKDLCENGNLVYIRDTLLIWTMPTDFLELFNEVVVMTYLFEGSMMANYLKAQRVPYTSYSLDADHRLIPIADRDETAVKAKLRDLIKVCMDPKLNAIGTPSGRTNPLSASWMKYQHTSKSRSLEVLKNNTYNFFMHKLDGSKSADNMWTTFKETKAKLTGKGYGKGFVSVNTKATNAHIERKNLAYLANIFIHPEIEKFFKARECVADQDLFALSEMIQWVWRSQIRRGDPINLYVPSQRMRGLFLGWLNEGVEQAEDEPLAA
jgi:hypothetical protein